MTSAVPESTSQIAYFRDLVRKEAELSAIGRTRWREVHTGKPMPGPSQTIMAVLRPKAAP